MSGTDQSSWCSGLVDDVTGHSGVGGGDVRAGGAVGPERDPDLKDPACRLWWTRAASVKDTHARGGGCRAFGGLVGLPENSRHILRGGLGGRPDQASSASDACCSAWGVQSCLRHLADTWNLPQPCRHEPRQPSRDHLLPSAPPEPSASVLPGGRHPPEGSPQALTRPAPWPSARVTAPHARARAPCPEEESLQSGLPV